jgi:hypothetical protein
MLVAETIQETTTNDEYTNGFQTFHQTVRYYPRIPPENLMKTYARLFKPSTMNRTLSACGQFLLNLELIRFRSYTSILVNQFLPNCFYYIGIYWFRILPPFSFVVYCHIVLTSFNFLKSGIDDWYNS